jgi:cold shock CspA family protein
MRYQGKITKWNDEKGFGFITRNDSNQQVFVHISAFGNTQQRSRPTVGEGVSFEIADDIKKGLQAYNVIYLNRQPSVITPKTSGRTSKVRASGIRLGVAAKIFCALLISAILYKYLDILNPGDTHGVTKSNTYEVSKITDIDETLVSNQAFQCAGKTYCSEMSSCEEARYYLKNCPGTITDGDGDGIPCEDQWCGH